MAEESSFDSHEEQGDKRAERERESGPEPGHLSPEDVSYMESVQKKRLIVMILAGIVILVLGFFAGKNLAAHKNAAVESPSESIAAVQLIEPVAGERIEPDAAAVDPSEQADASTPGTESARSAASATGMEEILNTMEEAV